MKLEVNGIEYEHFTSASAEIRLDALSNTFSFTAVSTNDEPLPFQGGEPCRVIVDDQAVVTGSIEIVSGSHDGNTHTISIQGRDKTGDLLDSNISSLSDLKETITLKAIIEKVLKNIDLTLNVIDEAGPDPFNPAEDIQAPESGDNAFEFLEALARKRQVLLTSNGDGDIVISESPGGDSGGILQNIIGANDNNILAASYSYDRTGRFNIYKMSSGMNPISLNNAGTTSISSLVNQSGIITDAQIRAGRQLVLVSEGSFSDTQDDKRAIWEANIRKARGRVYSATVQGYRPDPDSAFLWNVNELVTVVDNFAQINAQMLINTVAFGFDLQGGKTTTLSMIEKNSYQLTLEEPVSQDLGGLFG